MFTTIGWQESRAGTTGYTPIKACTDQHVRVEADIIYCPELNKLIGMIVMGGPEANEMYLSSPSLRRISLLDLGVIGPGVNQQGDEHIQLHPLNPIPLETNEGLEVYGMETATATAIMTAVAWLADGPLPPVAGEIYTVKADATITSITGQWVNAAITFRQTLPVGRYQIVGCRCKTSTGIAFRFVFVGGMWRPGGMCVNNIGSLDCQHLRYGRMGVWGEFDHLTPPTLELIAGTAAAQSPELYIDVIKVA